MTTQISTWLPHAGDHLIPGQVRIGGLWHDIDTAQPGLITTTDGRRLTGDVRVMWRVSQAPVPGSVQQRFIEDAKAEDARRAERERQVKLRERWNAQMARLADQALREDHTRAQQEHLRRRAALLEQVPPIERYLGLAASDA